jgi:ADP-ribose pyrophosphatase YjhB (NUDIX family)
VSKDIKIIDEKINFKYRVNGIIIKENKLLTVQINNSGFYCLPGGHVELGEDSKVAIVREMKEETNLDVEVERLLAIAENFYEGKNGIKYQELGFYYFLKLNKNINIKNYTVIEKDKDENITLEFKWYSSEELRNVKFKPDFIKEKIMNKDYSFVHEIISNSKL